MANSERRLVLYLIKKSNANLLILIERGKEILKYF